MRALLPDHDLAAADAHRAREVLMRMASELAAITLSAPREALAGLPE